jgi:MerR family transcriptional regulator/heat shock protein HspR
MSRSVKYYANMRFQKSGSEGPALDRRGLYGISVASELTGVPAQNLRVYEARGLIDPMRTTGGTRRYSDHDVARIERIATLLAAGLNLTGIGYVLDLEAETHRLRDEIERLTPSSSEVSRPQDH